MSQKHTWSHGDGDAPSAPIVCLRCRTQKTDQNQEADCLFGQPRPKPPSIFDDLGSIGRRAIEIATEEKRLLPPLAALTVAICLGVTLSACAVKQRVQMFTAADIANAEAVAVAGGDKTGADCWASLAPAVAQAPNPSAEGLATGAERSRLLQATLGGPCGGVAAPVLLSALKSVPSFLTPLVHLPIP